MSEIFVSYRRDDSAGHAGRLYDRLSAHFGKDKLFRDIDQIQYGEDFVEALDEAVGSCKSLIAVIGPHWLTAEDKRGRRRLESSNDFVRIEIESALSRGVPIIPVLVNRAEMPDMEDLPETLSGLARRQALEISEARFDYDVDQLLNVLEANVGIAPASDGGADTRVTKEPLQPHAETTPGPPADASEPRIQAPVAKSADVKAAVLYGGLIALAYSIVSLVIVFHDDQRLRILSTDMWTAFAVYAAFAVVVGGVCGATVGRAPGVLLPIAIAIAVVEVIWISIWGTYQDVVITGLILGGGVAAILVSIAWRLMARRRTNRLQG